MKAPPRIATPQTVCWNQNAERQADGAAGRHESTMPGSIVLQARSRPCPGATADGRSFRFSRPFHIGREYDCEIRLDDVQVSRKHLVVSNSNGHWEIRDLQSRNGMFHDGRRGSAFTQHDEGLTIRLGVDGPFLAFEVERTAPLTSRRTPPVASHHGPAGETRMLADYAERYFGSRGSQEEVGGRTRMIRKAFQDVQKKQRRKYGWVIAVAGTIAIVAGGYAIYGQRQINPAARHRGRVVLRHEVAGRGHGEHGATRRFLWQPRRASRCSSSICSAAGR